MTKLSLCLLFVVLAIAATQADDDRRPCLGRCTGLSSGKSVCIRNKSSNLCTRLPACRLREKNCRRRDSGLEPIRETCITRCRNIPGSSGVGKCASKLRPRPQSQGKRTRECQRRLCVDDKQAGCWRDQQGACILQTRCEAQRRNCVRDQTNQWVRASQWSCKGNSVGGGVRRCRKRPIVIKD
ncbi:uncharacterized protein LOC119557718 [Drosophila subpulchrella]|uniref:uncharacterized protein LOC119557718 n=1 Tax=Drosophila subpulchrella TaxID=1486046 RepID=UPI0018A12C3A|nr:uncharacterized protein LOC119557718 [Drosophila subpulchrella]